MQSERVRGLGAIAVLVALAVGVFWVSRVLQHKGMTWSADFGSIAAAFLAAAALLMPLFTRLLGWLRGPPPVSRISVVQARDDLAAALAKQDAEEERIRRVNDPRPLPVCWVADTSTGSAGSVQPPLNSLAGQYDEIASVFLRLRSRRLIILGEAGAGKSVLLIKLARELLAARDEKTRVPVVLSASAWDSENDDLSDWIANQLSRNHPGLAQRVRDSTGDVTTLARALAADMVLPFIDGLDELPAGERESAIRKINSLGSDLPLVLTSRPEEYLDIVRAGRGISGASVIRIVPLRLNQVKSYLVEATAGPSERWRNVFDHLGVNPDEPLAHVLSTPLTLWLARTVYENSDSDPSELLNVTLFPTAEALEDHLLGAFIPSVYEGPHISQRLPFRCTPEQAERWLGFLASYLNSIGQPGFAWWRIGRSARSWQVVTSALRVALLSTVLWVVANRVLMRYGHWHNKAYVRVVTVDRILFNGPLGPVVQPAFNRFYEAIRENLNVAWHGFLSAGSPVTIFMPWYSLRVFILSMAAIGAFVGFIMVTPAEPAGPSVLHFRFLSLLRSAATAVAQFAVITCLLAFVVLLIFRTSSKEISVVDFFSSRSTWQALLLISLFGVAAVPSSFQVPIDISRSLGPADSLRLNRYADFVKVLLRRVLVLAVLWALTGPQIAVAYAVYAGVATVASEIVLGGLVSPVRIYTNARVWLFMRRRAPWRLMSFLADAHRRGVLRQVGAVYNFRHIRLQDRLAARHPLPPSRFEEWANRELRL